MSPSDSGNSAAAAASRPRAEQSSAAAAKVSLRGLQKAAIVLITLGETASSEILRRLPDDAVERVMNVIARMDRVDPALAEAALGEAHQALTARTFFAVGGLNYARKMLEEAFGAETASRTMVRLQRALAGEEANFNHLMKVDAQQLAKLIQDEHPQTITVILSRLLPSQAAGVLTHLPQELHGDILRRMAALDQISPEVVRSVSNVVRQKLNAVGELSREACGGIKSVADICNRMDVHSCNHIMETLDVEDPDLAESIRRLMFTFADLRKLNQESLRSLMARVDKKVLTMALKGTNPDLQNHIFQQMSQRAAEMMREDMQALGAVRVRDVDQAQAEVITIATAMEKEGALALNRSGGEDDYVT
ncbi:MAG TPA: flagellar motor switch protein FliG [Bryobacteraceae bacterium]|nr:flagellar motor switch protein FliG [Bryobacteraceae bacterium]